MLLGAFMLPQLALAVPNFDPFTDATATGGTSYAVGSNLVGQNTSTLFAPWYFRGGNLPGAQPTIAAGSLHLPPVVLLVGQQCCLCTRQRDERLH